MKRVGYLYDKIVDIDNIVRAMEIYDERRPVKLRRGVDYRLAWEIKRRMESDFRSLIGKPRIKYIIESGKQRRLQIPSYCSIVAQTAMWNICGEHIENHIHRLSFSSRKGFGGHLAARKCERFVHTNLDGKAKYHLYFDIKKFYQHIDLEALKRAVARIIKDKQVLEMFDIVIDSSDDGLPIGYPFSHALANLVLVPLYYKICGIRNISKVYVYMDNWTIFSRYKAPLKRALALAKGWLKEIGCEVKQDYQIAPTEARGVKICGFIIGGKHTRLYRRIWHRIMRNVDRCERSPGNEHFKLSIMSRLGWLKAINRQFLGCFRTRKGKFLWT